ncbi:hypothetical protein NE237_030313 [Protea cynaroides]|uniref:Uncharacterized protein n=1 Tax=Protea cynaroides TaxID=273540 RepID=A0A9Q0GST8_9MAGN|nr:hypothetical protein NE237_030313 [Protea cynaroides]
MSSVLPHQLLPIMSLIFSIKASLEFHSPIVKGCRKKTEGLMDLNYLFYDRGKRKDGRRFIMIDVVQGRPSMFPMSPHELFVICDYVGKKIFLCACTAKSMQKFVFDGEAAKIGLEMKNLVACISFLVEQNLVLSLFLSPLFLLPPYPFVITDHILIMFKLFPCSMLADKDAEALRCLKLLVEVDLMFSLGEEPTIGHSQFTVLPRLPDLKILTWEPWKIRVLKIFTSKLVLASPEIASDANYAVILGAIVHESEEGLIVFRDQIFPLKRPIKWENVVTFSSHTARSFAFPVHGGQTMELAIAQFWSSGIRSHETTIVDFKGKGFTPLAVDIGILAASSGASPVKMPAIPGAYIIEEERCCRSNGGIHYLHCVCQILVGSGDVAAWVHLYVGSRTSPYSIRLYNFCYCFCVHQILNELNL